jgi:hypothetical protein
MCTTEYVVTTGSGRHKIYHTGTQFRAVEYAESYAKQHMKNTAVYVDDRLMDDDLPYSVEIVDGKTIATDHEAQQTEWEAFIEGEG